MVLADRVRVTQRYQRAIRIDTDIGDSAALDGFVCPQSSAGILEVMARHVAQSGQGGFTWTGPYGSGKSSLAVVLSAALAAPGDTGHMRRMASILGAKTLKRLNEALPPGTRGWRALPVIGRRDHPAQVIGEAIKQAGLLEGRGPRNWTEKRVLDTLEEIAASKPRASGGLIVFIDEMGKFLEAAAHDGFDIYLFQQLAELASRSGGRLIVVGILHQAFEEYAHRLSREMRDEWVKIQGRFVDLAVSTVGSEQIDLLGRAIDSDYHPKRPGTEATAVAALVRGQTSPNLAMMLEDCWPLHPITACLLGPVSRRRFGQNQRSIFGFLNSAEPLGFQDFLRTADEHALYGPHRLWDYLKTNLEPSILASPDGHRWALAAESIGRCEAMGGGDLHLRLLKVIAIVDLLKDHSGLSASRDLLKIACYGYGSRKITAALKDLESWSTVVYRKFSGAYSVFEGSDFDIDYAVQQALINMGSVDFTRMNEINSFTPPPPIVAKRHYHKTGALRWFDISIAPLSEIESIAAGYTPDRGAIGVFLLAVPTQGESLEFARQTCRNVARQAYNCEIVVGFSQHAWKIPDLAKELMALRQVQNEFPDLHGDRVARTEVIARISALQGQFESQLERALNEASWYRKQVKRVTARHMSPADLNALASDLADRRFDNAPLIHNELLCRMKPSSSAAAARNALLRRMILNEGEARLGIEGFPAEGGLFISLLEATGLYRKTSTGWHFVGPRPERSDFYNLRPMWKAAEDLLKANTNRSVSLTEIYDTWRDVPFGIKDGLLPVFAVAFILSRHETLAIYRQKIFQTEISELTVDYLTQDPNTIHLRWVDLRGVSHQLVSGLNDVLRNFETDINDPRPRPIDVARALVAIYDGLPRWVGCTQSLSVNAKRIRHMFKQANDPNKLIFDDMPKVLNEGETVQEKETVVQITNRLREGLAELQQAYPAVLNRIRNTLLAELQASDSSEETLGVLRDRATNIRELGGDHRLEAFIIRLARFEGHDADVESLAGMAINKSPQDWVDSDIDRASMELAELAQRFVYTEAFAHIKGRQDKRHAMAVVVGIGGCPKLMHDEFDITEMEQPQVTMLVERVETALRDAGAERRNIILATLAKMSMRYLNDSTEDRQTQNLPQKAIA